MDDLFRAAVLENLLFAGMPRKALLQRLVLHSGMDELLAFGLGPDLATELLRIRREKAEFAQALRAAKANVRILVRTMLDYPAELEAHPYGPRVIYAQGRALPPHPRVGIVGARTASANMLQFADRLGHDCGRAGIAVVSGLARGIDAAAHRGALAGDGACVGVLGCGIDITYPPDTSSVQARVREVGTMLTTFPFGTPPLPRHFPTRNRLLAALCDVVVVVQARHDSGSMSTARAALDAGIEVMAVPGAPGDPLCEGTNALIRDGARPVLESRDILEALFGVGAETALSKGSNPAFKAIVPYPPITDPLTAAILAEIGSVGRRADEIAHALGEATELILARLLELEIDGRVWREPGGVFRRRNRDDETSGPENANGSFR